PLTSMIYVANYDNTVSVINSITNRVITSIPVGVNPIGVSVNPLTNMIYVANHSDNTVSVINGTTNRIVPDPHHMKNPMSLLW
ncbi:MAG: hypothetical protein WAM14_19715, partial [Candidatus Nitrosopolaris sp.]